MKKPNKKQKKKRERESNTNLKHAALADDNAVNIGRDLTNPDERQWGYKFNDHADMQI